jgi:hypothetical protein
MVESVSLERLSDDIYVNSLLGLLFRAAVVVATEVISIGHVHPV